ncbi:MAG: helix-turn-helix transcriptional regulator [Bryobacterales bacterium]
MGKDHTAGGVALVSRPSGKDAYQLSTTPVSAAGVLSNDYRAAAAVLIADPDREVRTSQEALTELYDFTAQESRVATALLEGQTPREIGESLRLTGNTIRTHLKHVYSKADVRGQAELVRKLMRGLAEVARPRKN